MQNSTIRGLAFFFSVVALATFNSVSNLPLWAPSVS